eukprot:g6588.t1
MTKKKNTAIYKVGNIEIDIAIYHKGWWRMPMCAKKGDTRVLELKGSEGKRLSFEDFKDFSIHTIPSTSRKIEQELKRIIRNVNPIRTRRLNSLKTILGSGNKMSEAQKQYYGLKGDFELVKTIVDSSGSARDRFKAMAQWECPNKPHKNNRCLEISEYGLTCFGCGKTWPHVDPKSAQEDWRDKAKELIFDELRDTALFPYMGKTLPKDETTSKRSKLHWLEPEIKQFLANFFHSGEIEKDNEKIMLKLGNNKKKDFLDNMTFTTAGKYQLKVEEKWLDFGKHYITIYHPDSKTILEQKKKRIEVDLKKYPKATKHYKKKYAQVVQYEKKGILGRFKLPKLLKRQLYGFLDIPFDDALKGKPHKHVCDIEPHFDDNGTFIIGKDMPAIQFGSEDDLNPMERDRCPFRATFKKKALAIELGCGGGKTHAVVELLKSMTSILNQRFGSMYAKDTKRQRTAGQMKVLAVVARKSLGKGINKSLKELNFTYYEDKEPSVERLVCSVDSLQRFVLDENKFLRKYDCIVLDESELTFSHFGASTLRNSSKTFDLLKQLVKVTPHVIFMSADISKTNRTDLFAEQCGLDVQYIKSEAKTDVKSYYTLYKDDLLEYRILQAVKKGHKIVLYSNTAKFVKKVEMLLGKEAPDKKICAIYNEPGHEFTEAKLNNMHTYDIVLTSPSMSPGVSITEPFDVAFVYMLASEMTAGVLYMRQMTHRVRTIKTGAVFVKFDTHNCPFLSEDIEDIRDELTRNKGMLKDVEDIKYEFKEVMVDGETQHQYVPTHSPFNEMFISNEKARRKNARSPYYFKTWTEKDGGSIDTLQLTGDDITNIKKLKKELKTIGKECNDNKCDLLLGAQILTVKEFHLVDNIYDKVRFKRFKREPKPTEATIRNYNSFYRLHYATTVGDAQMHWKKSRDILNTIKTYDDLYYAKERFHYCERYGLNPQADIEKLKNHWKAFPTEDTEFKNASNLLLGEYKDDTKNAYDNIELLRVQMFSSLQKALGISIFDINIKEEKEMTVDEQAIRTLMNQLKPSDTLATETNFNRAKGNPMVWAKSAANVWGIKFGLSSTNCPIMTGNKPYRKFCIRGIPQKEHTGDRPYDIMMERLYMSQLHLRDTNLFPTKTKRLIRPKNTKCPFGEYHKKTRDCWIRPFDNGYQMGCWGGDCKKEKRKHVRDTNSGLTDEELREQEELNGIPNWYADMF